MARKPRSAKTDAKAQKRPEPAPAKAALTTDYPAPEVIEVRSRRVACDGVGGALGHPRVWLEMGEAARALPDKHAMKGYFQRRLADNLAWYAATYPPRNLLDSTLSVLGMVERGELTDGHARAVLAVPDNEGRRRLAREIVTKGLTVRAAERAARWAGAKRKPRREAPGRVDPALAERVRIACERATGFRPRVTATRVEIPIADEHELAELAEALERSIPEAFGT